MNSKVDRLAPYPRNLARAMSSAMKLCMPLSDFVRFFFAYTKNARKQLGSPEKFDLRKLNRFRTSMGDVYFRDSPTDPATLSELVENQYEFGRMAGDGAYVDVGACIGMSAKLFSYVNPGKRIFCFEPVEENSRLVRMNCPDARLYDIAIGKENGIVELGVDGKNLMAIKGSTDNVRRMNIRRLDEFSGEIGNVNLLKIDVEGSEVDVLLGARKVLAKTGEVRVETHSGELHRETKRILLQNGFAITKDAVHGEIGYLFARKSGDGA